MANAIGIGTFFPTAPTHVAPVVPAPLPAEAAPDPRMEEALLGLARVVAVLERHAGGLTASHLRSELALDPAVLARGLAEGVRTKQLRRTGARRTLRYVLNT